MDLRTGPAGLVVAIDFVRDETGAREVCRRVRAEGGTAEAFRADVTDENQVVELCRLVRATLGPIEVLVNLVTLHRGLQIPGTPQS